MQVEVYNVIFRMWRIMFSSAWVCGGKGMYVPHGLCVEVGRACRSKKWPVGSHQTRLKGNGLVPN